jgi:MmyB-like transcription regulator ligand binding domain
VRPNVQRLLDAMTDVPAVVMDGRTDALAANQLGRALFAPVYAGPSRPTNFARFTFLDPCARDFWPTGTALPTTPSSCYVRRPAAIPTTRR